MTPNGLHFIGHGTYEDSHGVPWVFNPQRGWIEVSPHSRATRFAKLLRLAHRQRRSRFTFEGKSHAVFL